MIQTADGRRMYALPLFVDEGKKQSYLNDHPTFEETTHLEIHSIRRRWFRHKKVPHPLTPNLKAGILLFLQKYHAKTDLSFDCYSFANLVNKVHPHDKKDMFDYWHLRSFEPRDGYSIGHNVFLFDEGGHRFNHAAICLDGELFLSVYGAGGDLEVSTLEDMVRNFRSSSVRWAIPRPWGT